MLRAVPSTMRIADSTLTALVSGSFFFAISSICARVTWPTFWALGLPLPDAMPVFEGRGVVGRVEDWEEG